MKPRDMLHGLAQKWETHEPQFFFKGTEATEALETKESGESFELS